MALFYPTIYRRRITDVQVEDLRRLGVRAILLDVDNTLTTHDAPDLDPQVRDWLTLMEDEGFALVIVSNNRTERVEPFAHAIHLPFVAHGCKPLPKGYRTASAMLGIPLRECIAIGDQIFTDILGGNLFGCYSILVEPIQPESTAFFKFKRFLEKIILFFYRKKAQ